VTNPMGWEEKTIEEIVADTKLGLVRSSNEFGWDYPIRYVRMDAVTTDGKFLPEKVQFTDASKKEREAFALHPGDFLFNTRNSKELVGKVCVFPGPDGWLFNNNLMRIRFRDEIEPTVIAAQFQFRRVQRELEQRKSGTTSVFAVYWKSLRTLPILVPALDRQRRFAAIVESVERQKARMRAHLAELDALFASLQSRAFSGTL
jgi:type I restriction enzyme, S subunit